MVWCVYVCMSALALSLFPHPFMSIYHPPPPHPNSRQLQPHHVPSINQWNHSTPVNQGIDRWKQGIDRWKQSINKVLKLGVPNSVCACHTNEIGKRRWRSTENRKLTTPPLFFPIPFPQIAERLFVSMCTNHQMMINGNWMARPAAAAVT